MRRCRKGLVENGAQCAVDEDCGRSRCHLRPGCRLIARRILCYAKKDRPFRRGERFGFLSALVPGLTFICRYRRARVSVGDKCLCH